MICSPVMLLVVMIRPLLLRVHGLVQQRRDDPTRRERGEENESDSGAKTSHE